MHFETPEALGRAFADLARELGSADGVDETLQLCTERTVALVEHCEHAGVSWIRGRAISTRAASSDVPVRVDAIQYETGQGPCLDAIRGHGTYRVGDLLAETRWPSFAARAAAETGVRSILSFRLFLRKDTLGALNLYSSRRDAFDETDEAVGAIVAAHSAVALQGAAEQERADQLSQAQATNRVIGQAVGILMATRHISAHDAFGVLRAASSHMNVKLRDIAAQVVERQQAGAGR
ncbi:GAF and ANTAR domain-containing protein [Motilibacter aurantiacus]|uniref:GAF and ANTAR domain-containing protein n=1 Tax=Motilibacter aurantiacus TaxID=2714955 RepID=UPI00140CED2C|nr:GAF and ANTAR domain-containing protein [Motilibacter aurantiacus]NHC44957.1 GAF and ANTAR domain-containing protein [Motilibacter aurantiacus]